MNNSRSRKKVKRTSYADWDEWNPALYLDTYFHDLRRDEDETLEFLVKSIKKLPKSRKLKVLEFGTGPTVVHGLVVSPTASEIHFADYLEKNLFEIKKWLRGAKGAFDWNLFMRRILQLEGKPVTEKAVKSRTKELRRKVTKLLLSDAALKFPLKGRTSTYDLIIMTYCVDSATSSKRVWRKYMRNVLRLLAPKGTILIAALHKCKFYTIGSNYFPSANITEDDLKDSLLENGFKSSEFNVIVKEVPECLDEGYGGILFARATRT